MIRVGVVGVGRGQSFASSATEHLGMKLVALCDIWKERVEEVGRKYKVATYTEFDKFLEHDLDAVVLANYFHEHAPLAIKALRAGKHVMSETSACKTLAEGVALCREVERSRKQYMFAENYPFTVFNLEMRRLYQAGEIGRILYAEGEYNHPMSPDDRERIAPGRYHWRHFLPSTYYCTHALAPLVNVTGEMPVSVIGLSVAAPECDAQSARVADPTSVILCRTEGGAVFRIFGLLTPGHSNWYRFHGTRGAMESERGTLGYFGTGRVRVWHEDWDVKRGEERERIYTPDWPEHGDLARKAGHGGGDFWTTFHFANAIRSGKPPFLDVYRGVGMSCVGVLAWKSALKNGQPFDLPDFRSERARKPHANDDWSPFPADRDARPDQPPPSIRGFVKPNPRGLKRAQKNWRAIGYKGS